MTTLAEAPALARVTDPHAEAIARVVAAVDADPGRDWTVDEMARIAMFSKFHFTRIFTRHVGTTPGRYLMDARIRRAQHLLLMSSLTVTDVTHEVGYTGVGTFSSRFSGEVGVSPSEYRRRGGDLSTSTPAGVTS